MHNELAHCRNKNRIFFYQPRMYDYNMELIRILPWGVQTPLTTLKKIWYGNVKEHSLKSLSRNSTWSKVASSTMPEQRFNYEEGEHQWTGSAYSWLTFYHRLPPLCALTVSSVLCAPQLLSTNDLTALGGKLFLSLIHSFSNRGGIGVGSFAQLQKHSWRKVVEPTDWTWLTFSFHLP